MEKLDGLTKPFIKHLNASVLLNNEEFGLDDETIQLDVSLLPENYTLDGMGKTAAFA